MFLTIYFGNTNIGDILKLIDLIIIFGAGGIIYCLIEILFRGYTHISMLIAGGLIFTIIYYLFNYIGNGHWFMKCTLGCAIITTVEFLTGVGINIIFNMNVWDYSQKAFNLYGQICLAFSIGWFFISIPAAFVAEFIRRELNKTGIRKQCISVVDS